MNELEAVAGEDIDYRLRTAVGRVALEQRHGTFADCWSFLEPLVPYVEWSDDPEAKSTFLAHCAFINVAGAHYEAGLRFASEGMALCKSLRLRFALASFATIKFEAEIGQRSKAAAQRTLALLQQLAVTEGNPLTLLFHHRCEIRWRLFRGSFEHELAIPPALAKTEKELQGEIEALHAVVHALVGDARQFNKASTTARALGSTAETNQYLQLANALITLRDSPADPQEIVDNAVESIRRAGYPDALVMVYRAYPEFLAYATEGSEADYVWDIVRRAHDRALASRLGLSPPSGDSPAISDILTDREIEVGELMMLGLTNQEIGEKLVIAPSTAKVHAHNVRKKLGASTRLGAIARYRELIDH